MFLNKSLFLVFTAFVLCESGFDFMFLFINDEFSFSVEQLPKCKLNDDNCKKGLIQTVLKILAKTGLPEKGIPKLDPLSVSNESFKIADVIDLTLVDGVVKGIKDCTVNRFTASIEDERATIELTCDVTIKGRYKVFSDSPLVKTFSGGDTVKGEGNGKVKIEKMFLRFDFDYFFQDRDGEIYVKCKNDKLKYQYDIKGKMLFFADNLFVGGKESSKVVMDAMNQNWKFLMSSFGKPFMDHAMDFVIKSIHTFFDSVPAKYMFADDLTEHARKSD
ncbi:hypothetical protein HW555_003603 [Spodoptera exigua]|uniref:Uncharacterized protein n=1 Tax=Spodoptera exigua TaxID=7107 RepID=A0A835L6V6_SPOEX|nr:hypothetical protein HW555_003603 [Spodoptera exigua]